MEKEQKEGKMKKAFTLAEVLITLMIIGIVAALTIPSVISNYQQQEFKTGLKKAVSVLNEAIQTNIAQDGETPYDTNANLNILDYLKRHMSVIKSGDIKRCTEWRNTQCRYSGLNQSFYTTDGMRFETNSGVNLRLHETGSTAILRLGHCTNWGTDYLGNPSCQQYKSDIKCGSYGLLSNPSNTTSAPCIITVDVNGDRGPNSPTKNVQKTYYSNGEISGSYSNQYTYPSPTDKKLQDIFSIMITDEKAIPFGVVAQRAMYSK